MQEIVNMGFISIIPAIIAIVLSFVTRNTIVSLMSACIVGTLLAGQGIMGFPTLLKTSLGTTSFAWIMLLNTFIGILVAYFQKTGAIQGFTKYMKNKKLSRARVQLASWVMGMFVYFSDSFSPLFVGATMRSVSDEAKVSREKLSYIADSTSAPVSVLMPITGWAAFLSGLAIGVGSIVTQEDAMSLFIKAIPMNFYPIISIIFVGLIGSGIIKDFGPMKKAEDRAMNEGKVLRDGAVPLIGKELTDMEAFLFVIIFMSISMVFQGIPFKEVMNTATDGVKGAIPAIMLLALAYSVNQLSKDMGTANYIVDIAKGFLTPQLLPAVIFLISAVMAFSTGSSWGTFAICMPIALPLAFSFSGRWNSSTERVHLPFLCTLSKVIYIY